MTNTLLANFLVPRDEREDGFTLIEILVVIIIIGILAAVAIPIFLNQQRTARDSATTSDVRNLATNVETALVSKPEADFYGLYAAETGGSVLDASSTKDMKAVWVQVGTSGPDGTYSSRIQVSKTKGTQLQIAGKGAAAGQRGQYVITGWNADGQEYKDVASGRKYDSSLGGMQK